MHMFNDSTDVMRAAAVGLGIGLARQHIAAPWLQRGELLRLPGPVLKTRFAYYVVHPAHRRPRAPAAAFIERSEEHTSELQSLMRISYADFCLKKKININAKTDKRSLANHINFYNA